MSANLERQQQDVRQLGLARDRRLSVHVRYLLEYQALTKYYLDDTSPQIQ